MKVRPISITQPIPAAIPGLPEGASPEAVVVYCARVSNPKNQQSHESGERLLRYCIRHGHWSVFEMVDWTVEIETSRAIAAQILRHRSFSFQEFSQRYSATTELGDDFVELVELRPRGATNRQGSDELNALPFPHALKSMVLGHLSNCKELYRRLIEEGVAPECARMVLPLSTMTRLYMKGSVRSWIHYFAVRRSTHTQKEHRQIADALFAHFKVQFPTIAAALEIEEK